MAEVAAPLMPIGELARRADVPVRTLRQWSDRGIVPPAHRTDAGYRMFGERERLRLETVKAMRSLGFHIDEISAVLATHDELGTGLAAQLDAVRTRMADLERFALVLEAVLERCDEPTAVHLARLQTIARLFAGAGTATCAREGDHGEDAGAPAPDAPGLPELAEHPTFEQLDAWLELAALLAEETVDVTGGGAGQPVLLDVLHDAMEARTSGVTPDDPRADGLVQRLLAHASARSDGAQPHRLLDHATPGGDLRTRRYWRLVARIKGWPEQSPQAQAVDWLAAALRVRCG